MDPKSLVIFGGGEIAEIADFYFSKDSDYRVEAFCLDGEYIKEPRFAGRPVVAFEDVNKDFPTETHSMAVIMGYSKYNKIRQEKYEAAKNAGYKLASYISSKATIYDTPVGENCMIFEDNTIQPFTSIGNNVIMWSGNHFGHHSHIGDHCFISSHVVISGGVEIGKNCFIGVNTTIRDHIKIGDYAIIGMNGNIQKDVPEYSIMKTQATEGVVKQP